MVQDLDRTGLELGASVDVELERNERDIVTNDDRNTTVVRVSVGADPAVAWDCGCGMSVSKLCLL